MKQTKKKIDPKPGGRVSTSALRLARVALGISQREAAIACGVGWRTMQRLELDEPVADYIREKIKAEWERRGIVFLNPDAAGWGIRVPKRSPEGPFGHEAFKSLRVGLALSVKEAADRAKVTPRELNIVENDDDVSPAIRDKVKNAYTDAGVKLLTPGRWGWGFRIPETLSPETGRVLLIRPRRKPPAKALPDVDTSGTEADTKGAAKATKAALSKKAATAAGAPPSDAPPAMPLNGSTKTAASKSAQTAGKTPAKKSKASPAKRRKTAAPKAKK